MFRQETQLNLTNLMLSRRSVIIKNSAVHRELLKRKDAPQALLECYRELDIKDTPYADIMFFEAFLASDYVIPILKNKSLELGTKRGNAQVHE